MNAILRHFSYYQLLLIGYAIFFTFFYFVPSAMFYFFGWYYDKRLRIVRKKVTVSQFGSRFLRFRGIPYALTPKHTPLCIRCEVYALVSFTLLEILSFILVMSGIHPNIAIYIGRFSFAYFLIAVIGFASVSISSSRKFKKDILKMKKENKIRFTSFRQLDDIALGMENLEGWTPELMTKTISTREMARNEAHAKANEGKIEAIDSGLEKMSKMHPMDKEVIPTRIRDNSDKLLDFSDVQYKLVSEDDDDYEMPSFIGIENYGFISEEDYEAGSVQGLINEHLDEIDPTHARNKDVSIESINLGDYGFNVKEDFEAGSVQGLINEHLDEIDPTKSRRKSMKLDSVNPQDFVEKDKDKDNGGDVGSVKNLIDEHLKDYDPAKLLRRRKKR